VTARSGGRPAGSRRGRRDAIDGDDAALRHSSRHASQVVAANPVGRRLGRFHELDDTLAVLAAVVDHRDRQRLVAEGVDALGGAPDRMAFAHRLARLDLPDRLDHRAEAP